MSRSSHAPSRALATLRSLLYPGYRHGGRVNRFLRVRLRPAGIGLLLVLLAVACIAAGNISPPVLRLLSFCLLLGLLSLLALAFRRAPLEAVRRLPEHATTGETVRIRYQLRHRGRRRLRRAWLIEAAPEPQPTRRQFLLAREPGAKQRNWFDRTLSYDCWNWLREQLRSFESHASPQPLDLHPGQSARFVTALTPNRRGLIHLRDLRVLLPDPLGFFQRSRRVPCPDATLVVLPKRHRLPDLELPGAARLQPGGDAVARQPGASGEFVGLREYRPGDPLRLIHWKSWARTGQPIVKELEDLYFPRHGLLLDTCPADDDAELFEAAVSVAASFVASVDTRECLIDLMFIAGRERVLSAGRGTGRTEQLLEALAAVEPSAKPDEPTLERLVLRHREDLAGCLAVFAGWKPRHARLVDHLRAAGLETSALVVCREPAESVGPGIHFLRLDTLAAEMLKLPARL